MKVIATEDGFIGKGRKGVLVRKGTIFEFTGEKLGKWMKPAGGPVPEPVKTVAESGEGPTAKEIRAQLDAAGVPYNVRASKPELLALLKEVVDKASPGASTFGENLTDRTE